VCRADNLPPSCAVVTKSGKLNFLEPSGPVQACNGTALPLLQFGKSTRSTEFRFYVNLNTRCLKMNRIPAVVMRLAANLSHGQPVSRSSLTWRMLLPAVNYCSN